MTTTKHLWAIGFDDMTRADEVRDKIVPNSAGARDRNENLILKDVVVVSAAPRRVVDHRPTASGSGDLFLAVHRGRLPHRHSAIRAAHGARPS